MLPTSRLRVKMESSGLRSGPISRDLGPRRKVVVHVIPADLVAEGVEAGPIVDDEQLGPAHRREVGQVVGGDVVAEARVMRAACQDPGRGVRLQVGAWAPDGTRDRQLWQW